MLGNTLGTREKWKKNPSPKKSNWKEKKVRHLDCMLGPSHWLHEISLLKRVCHQFLAWANNNTSGKEHLREKVCLFSKDVKLVLVYLGAINRVLILHLQAQNSHVNQSDIIVVQRLVFHKTNNHLRKLSYVTKQARADFNSLCCLWWDSTPSNG